MYKDILVSIALTVKKNKFEIEDGTFFVVITKASHSLPTFSAKKRKEGKTPIALELPLVR